MNAEQSLAHLKNKNEFVQLYSKKKRTRWDDNIASATHNAMRKTRWSAEYERTFIPLPFIKIPENLDFDQFEILIRRHRLEDTNRRIQTNDYENADPDLRSPSPEPIYDSKTGHRLNTRDVRTKEKYIKEKNTIIEELILLDETYIPPHDYRPPKKMKKIYIDENENEKHKLVGLVLGPDGITQKDLEKKSGCKISVRGKGSNWNTRDKSYHDENEKLHVYITADNEEQIRKATALIEPILNPFTEEHLYHKRMQKQAIAVKYGYNTDTFCENCGEKHRTWACPENLGNFQKVDLKCAICQDKSHPTIDCPERMKFLQTEKNKGNDDLSNFIKEVEELTKQTDIQVIEKEILPGDIRNSVLLTGKINETINNDELITETKPIERKPDITLNNNSNIKEPIIIPPVMIYPQIIPQIRNIIPNQNQDYRLPMMPIVSNPNVIRSAPVNYMQINPMMYAQGMNPSSYNPNYYNPIVTPMNTFPQANPYLNQQRNLNFISNNFQGKIPNTYGIGGQLNPLNYQMPGIANMPMGAMSNNVRINLPNNARPPIKFQPSMNMNQPKPNYKINNNILEQPPEPEEESIPKEPKAEDDIIIE